MLGITLWDMDEDPNAYVSVTENSTADSGTTLHVFTAVVPNHQPARDIVIKRNQAYELFMWLGHWLFTEHEDEIQPGEKIWGEEIISDEH